ncbi:MAG: alanine dehydrogenase [Hyphomicrobiales bacterium]|nr:alanine dehydrogenase [Hyphomicrobiales bacterium]
MRIGVIKEIKDKENRVALTPHGARELMKAGHIVTVEKDAGLNSGYPDRLYTEAGCLIANASGAWNAEMVLKIKEPLESEYGYFNEGQIIFTYFHLAGVAPPLTQNLLEKKVSAIAYETVRDDQGGLPLLAPMSGVAGAMSVSVANTYLARYNDGKGALLGSVLGIAHGKIVIIGDGIVGQHAAKAAIGNGTNTFIFTRHEERFAKFKRMIGPDLNCVLSSDDTIRDHLKDADAVIGSVLLPGARAPHVVSEEMVKDMQPGSVIVDVSIDQGGCIATSRPTSHSDPVYRLHDVTHYCVTNMPGAYPMTSTAALTNATIPHALLLAEKGMDAAKIDRGLAEGVNTYKGALTNKAVAEALGMVDQFQALEELLP